MDLKWDLKRQFEPSDFRTCTTELNKVRKVNTVNFKTRPFCTLTPTRVWGTKTKPGMGMPLRTETIAKPTETIAETGKQLGMQH